MTWNYMGHKFEEGGCPEAKHASGYRTCSRCGHVINIRYFHGCDECPGKKDQDKIDLGNLAAKITLKKIYGKE